MWKEVKRDGATYQALITAAEEAEERDLADNIRKITAPVVTVMLQHPSEPIKLTLVHAMKHFEVHLDSPLDKLPSMCPEIREMLLDAVDSAATAFRFTNSRATVAFQCPCSPDDTHTATPNDAHSNHICTISVEMAHNCFVDQCSARLLHFDPEIGTSKSIGSCSQWQRI